jgi:glycolate oxidase FAD binding subunit
MNGMDEDSAPSTPGHHGAIELEERAPTAHDAVDGVIPTRVVRVRSVADAVEIVRSSNARRQPLVIRGGGTQLSVGNPPRRLASIVAMDAMARLLSYSPDDMVITTEAGMTLAGLDRVLAPTGQRVALEAPNPELATIGGLAAANFNGGIAYGFGYPRDQILGMTVVDGVGRVLRAGGRVVKNVAGYDLPRVLVGSLGTLAVIADVTLRTQPRPAVVDRCTLDFTDERSLEAIRQRLFGSRLPLRSFDILGEYDRERLRWRMHLSMEGSAKQVEYLHASIKTLAREEACHVDVPGSGTHSDDGANFVARFATTPSTAVCDASILLARAHTIVEGTRVLLECGGALIRLRATCTSREEFAALIQLCKERNEAGAGTLLLESIPSEQKRDVDVWCGPIYGLHLMRHLKAKFDPNAVLAPGRFVGGI